MRYPEMYRVRQVFDAPRVGNLEEVLNREMASQTTFAAIAREMRKYYVTLLVIDQRPSQIDDEVMSQLGTRICGCRVPERIGQSVIRAVRRAGPARFPP